MPLVRRFSLSRVGSVAVGLLLDVTFAFPSGYTELRMAALKQCQAIDPADYQSGLFFNPDGYRSYYVRSECFQKTAVQFRDDALCADVRQWVSLLSDAQLAMAASDDFSESVNFASWLCSRSDTTQKFIPEPVQRITR